MWTEQDQVVWICPKKRLAKVEADTRRNESGIICVLKGNIDEWRFIIFASPAGSRRKMTANPCQPRGCLVWFEFFVSYLFAFLGCFKLSPILALPAIFSSFPSPFIT